MVYKHLSDYLIEHAQAKATKTALIDGETSLSWKQLWHEVEQVSGFFSQYLGSDNQKIVSILMPNCWQFVVTHLAILHSGHISQPIDVIYKTLEIDAINQQIPADIIVTDEANKSRIRGFEDKTFLFDDMKSANVKNSKTLRLDPSKQIASLVFTSGTTGKPKAATYSHSNHIWNIEVCSGAWGWSRSDTLLINLRLSHWYGMVMGLSGALYHGNTLYLLDRFEPGQCLELLASGKISLFTHTPFAYQKFLEQTGDWDLTKVRLFISGSSPLPPRVWADFKKRFGQEIIECYGTTETGRIASNTSADRAPGSPGYILPGVKMKLNSGGQISVKSPGLFPGYFNNKEATRMSLNTDGYWKTGDTGRLENDRLILSGRSHERIRRQGYSISPRDVEWALLKNKQIKEAFVLGVQKDGNYDDEIVYFISGDIKEEEIIAYSKVDLPSVWRPDKIFILNHLPRNLNGKPSLPKLRAMV